MYIPTEVSSILSEMANGVKKYDKYRDELLKKIIKKEYGDINTKEDAYEQFTFLHYATFHADMPTMRCLIRNGADVNIQNNLGKTPLHYALRLNNPWLSKVIELLLENGADINIKDKDGYTLFDLADINGIEEITSLLENFVQNSNMQREENNSCEK